MKDVRTFPLPPSCPKDILIKNTKKLISITKNDWDKKEISIDFKAPSLINKKGLDLRYAYHAQRTLEENEILNVKKAEEEINTLLIKAYSLEEEISPEVQLS
nr:hypothetical protein [Klebsiella variicola]